MFSIDMNAVYAGLQVMFYGLGGVFLVLILFYLITKLLMTAAKKAPSERDK